MKTKIGETSEDHKVADLVGRLTACAYAIGRFVANAPCGKTCELSPVIMKMYKIVDEIDKLAPGFKKDIEEIERQKGAICS